MATEEKRILKKMVVWFFGDFAFLDFYFRVFLFSVFPLMGLPFGFLKREKKRWRGTMVDVGRVCVLY